MHLYLAFLVHRDYFGRLDSSLSGSSVPQGLFRPPGFISICLFCSTGIISAARIHLYLAFLLHRDYFGRPDSSLSGSFPPQGLFRSPGCISIWLFCSTGIISAVWIHLYLAFLFHRDYFNRPDSSLSCSFAPQGLFQPPGFISICLFCSTGIIPAVRIHLYLAFLAYKWYASSIFPTLFVQIKDITKAGNLENTRFPASGDDGDRTRDLQIANLALSQLSYIPLFTNNDEYSTIVRKMSTQEFR